MPPLVPAPLSRLVTDKPLLPGLIIVLLCGGYLWFLGDPGAADWRWDDTQILATLGDNAVLSLFFVPESWQTYSVANLTPWLLLSYRLDWLLFGLHPSSFYLHQLLSLLLVGFLLYLCSRLWLRRDFALAGVLLFFAGAPIAYFTQQLMTRHYLEGALFSLLAVYCYVRYLRGHNTLYWVIAAGAYLLAVTAKEVYVPLVILLPFLPVGGWRSRLRACMPFVVVAALYVAWRGYMLESVTGGYNAGGLGPGIVLPVLVSFGGIPRLLFGDAWWFVTALLFVSGTVYFISRPRRLGLALLLSGLVLAPLIPLVESPGINSPDRYLFLPWLVIAFAFSLFAQATYDWLRVADTSWRKAGGAAVLITVIAVSLGQSIRAKEAVGNVGREFDAHARFIREHSDRAHYIPSPVLLSSFWFVDGFEALKERYLSGSSPRPVIDPLFLDEDIPALYVYDQQCGCFEDDSASLSRRLAEFDARYRPQASLHLDISYSERLFAWRLGPYGAGDWHFLSEELGVAPVPAAGSLRLYISDGDALYLRYTSPEGWVTYSDAIEITHPMGRMTWTRE